MADEPKPDTKREERIDSTFRNGLVTAVGVILAFSLGFLNQWVSSPIDWSLYDVAAAVPLALGIVLQAKALADLLATTSLVARHYDRARRIFMVGFCLVALGIAVAIALDIFGAGPRSAGGA
jgi:hypothetical protein